MWHWFKDIFSLHPPPPHHSYLSHIYLMLETPTGHTGLQKVDFLPLCTGLATLINLLGGSLPFSIMELSVDGANPRCLVMWIHFSVRFSIIFNNL
jgi:hypothetical protein